MKEPPAGVDRLWAAQSLLRRRQYDDCIELTTELLKANPYDQVGSGPPHIRPPRAQRAASRPQLGRGGRPTGSKAIAAPARLPQAAWYLKTRALTQKNFIDDLEVEEEARPAAYPTPDCPL